MSILCQRSPCVMKVFPIFRSEQAEAFISKSSLLSKFFLKVVLSIIELSKIPSHDGQLSHYWQSLSSSCSCNDQLVVCRTNTALDNLYGALVPTSFFLCTSRLVQISSPPPQHPPSPLFSSLLASHALFSTLSLSSFSSSLSSSSFSAPPLFRILTLFFYNISFLFFLHFLIFCFLPLYSFYLFWSISSHSSSSLVSNFFSSSSSPPLSPLHPPQQSPPCPHATPPHLNLRSLPPNATSSRPPSAAPTWLTSPLTAANLANSRTGWMTSCWRSIVCSASLSDWRARWEGHHCGEIKEKGGIDPVKPEFRISKWWPKLLSNATSEHGDRQWRI